MTGRELLIALMHRLRRYDDTVILYALLQSRADQTEFRTSATRVAANSLGGLVTRLQVHRALKRLERGGYIATRVYRNHRTAISVDGDAVRALLAIPVSDLMPGIRTESFPFLEERNRAAEDQTQDAAEPANPRMKQGPDGARASASGIHPCASEKRAPPTLKG